MTDQASSQAQNTDEELGPHGLTHTQYRQLLAAINEARVLHLQGDEYLATWDVEAHLTRIFGFGGWDDEDVVPPEKIFEESRQRRDHNGQPIVRNDEPVLGWFTAYKCTVKLTVRTINGARLAVHTGDATGSAENQPNRAEAHDLAIKSAASIALKRAAIKLGDQFGLSLYLEHRKPGDRVVRGTLVWEDPDRKDTDANGQRSAEGVAVTALGDDDVGMPGVNTSTGDVQEKEAASPQQARPHEEPAAATRPRRSGERTVSGARSPSRRAGDGTAESQPGGNDASGTASIPRRGAPEWRQPQRALVRQFQGLARGVGVDEAAIARFFQESYGVEGPGDLHGPALVKLVDRLASDDGLQGFKTTIASLTSDVPAPDAQARPVTTGGGKR